MPLPVALRESVRIIGGVAPLWRFHVLRLAEGGAPPFALGRASAEVERACALPADEPFTLDVFVLRDGTVTTRVRHEASSLDVVGGPMLAAVRVTHLPVLPGNAAKPATRRYWDGPHRIAMRRGAHQAALHLPDGTLIDGSTATLWVVHAGVVCTPPAPPAIAGVARRAIFELGKTAGIQIAVRSLTLDALADADEVFLSNAVGGVRAVRGRGGPTCCALSAALAGIGFLTTLQTDGHKGQTVI